MIECQMSYCDKTGGVEPTLRELGHFISTESLTESAPVYGKHSSMVYKSNSDSPKKSVFRRKTTSSARITTLTTEVNRQTQALKKLSSEKEVCKVCQGSHMIFKCSVFLTKSVGWRRRFARLNTLCYRCFSSSHLQRECSEKNGCTEKDCAHPSSHHLLLHLPELTPNQTNNDEKSVHQLSPRNSRDCT